MIFLLTTENIGYHLFFPRVDVTDKDDQSLHCVGGVFVRVHAFIYTVCLCTVAK